MKINKRIYLTPHEVDSIVADALGIQVDTFKIVSLLPYATGNGTFELQIEVEENAKVEESSESIPPIKISNYTTKKEI